MISQHDLISIGSDYLLQATFPWQEIDQSHKSHNAPDPYPTMHHSEQKCAHFCSEWFNVGYGTGALWICEILSIWEDHVQRFTSGDKYLPTVFIPHSKSKSQDRWYLMYTFFEISCSAIPKTSDIYCVNSYEIS